MMSYEQDPDVVRWGLQDLEVCCRNNAGYCSSVTRYETDSALHGYVREGFNETVTGYVGNEAPVTAYVENDAVIAQLYQEELSRVAEAEVSGSTNSRQQSVVSQEWFRQQEEYGKSRNNTGRNEKEEHSPDKEENELRTETREGENHIMRVNSLTEEDSLRPREIEEDCSSLDGEVGKRLNQMFSVPHVPKINGELPSEDEQISDHERLLQRLELYGLVENKVKGDGNCQFRSLSDQLYRSPEHHKFVREQIVYQLKYNREMYEGYVPMGYDEYLKKISRNSEWGDHVTLQAAADWFGVRIFVITSFKDTCYIEILPHKQKSNRLICLSFWAEVHYNSIYPEGELSGLEGKKKKKWWAL